MSTSKIRELVKAHAVRLHVDPDGAVKNALNFARLVGLIENDGRLTGENPNSSASGLYQFVKGSIRPALNRLTRYLDEEDWMTTLMADLDINSLSWEQQTLLFLGDMLEKKGSDVYMKSILETGSAVDMMSAYLVLHHTNPDEATIKRANRIMYGAIG